jgi:hypothetical protein
MSAPRLMVGGTLPGNDRDVLTGEVGSLQWASRQALGAHQRALGALIAVIGSREITAGIEPARRNGKVATLAVGLGHDVSTVLGIGRQGGSQPRAKISITIMRAPQRGHGQGSTRRASGVISGCFLWVGRRDDMEQCAGCRDVLSAVGVGQEPIVADAMEALGQHVPGRASRLAMVSPGLVTATNAEGVACCSLSTDAPPGVSSASWS